MTVVAVPKYGRLGEGFSAKERLAASEDAGRPWTRLAGGYISDLCALKKFVMLCPFCLPKFNPRRQGYEVWRQSVYNVGRCDGCRQHDGHLRGFIHQDFHEVVGEAHRRPRRGRWARSHP